MKTIYVDVNQFDNVNGVFVNDNNIVLKSAGAVISAMDIKDYNEDYKRFKEEYDIQFIFENNVPKIDIFTIPMVDIFAVDSEGGYIASLGEMTNLRENIPICYIDKNHKCYFICDNGKDFINNANHWKNMLKLCSSIEIFDSKESAMKQYEFL